MNRVLTFALGLTCAGASFGSTTTQPKKTTGPAKNTKAGSQASTSSASAAAHSHGKRGHGSHAVQRGPSFQTVPTPERYQEIQSALASHGFYKGEANGTWGPDSVEALKAFQTSQNLPNDGKISSLSLIGLGLGPAHSYPGGTVPAPTQSPASSTPGGPSSSSAIQSATAASTPVPLKPASPQSQANQSNLPAATSAPLPARPPQP
jgi:Putative peptidoglycan binding domain